MFPNLTRAREAGADSRRRFFRLFGAASRATHPRCRGGRAPGRSGRRRLAPAITFLWNDGGAGRAMGSASPRPARTGVGMGRRRVFSLDFPAGGIVLFIHWWGGAEPIGAAYSGAWRRRLLFYGMTAALAAATSELGGRLRNRAIATARPWPSDVLTLGFRAPADWPIATH